jgi:hypothetical protein
MGVNLPLKLRLIALLVILLVCAVGIAQASAPTRQSLFFIERSKNANIVQYDAQVDSSGRLVRDEPVVAYWIRLAEQGQEKELSWMQWLFAFGFDTKFTPENGIVGLEMNAGIDRLISIVRDGERFRARVVIDGFQAYLDRVFIKSQRKGFFVDVDYIELFGEDIESAGGRYEKIIFDDDG